MKNDEKMLNDNVQTVAAESQRKDRGSLSQQVSRGVLWVTFATICVRLFNIISAVILARLLSPSDFGLMAIAMAIISFSQGTTQTGFESALIQRQNKSEEFLNTAWTFELLRYFVLFLIIYFTAPLFASFFKEPRVVPMLRVIGLSLVVQGLRNIGVVYFRKNLDFHKQFVLEIVPVVVYLSVVIPLAFFLKTVWALVWATLATSVTSCGISYIMHPYRPRLEFETEKARELFNFGKWILGSSIIVMLREQGVTMFIGKLLGMTSLGFYNRACAFSTAIFQQVNDIVWKVGYPAYSQLQAHPERFRQVNLKTLKLLTFIGIPMAGGLFVLSTDFVRLFLTDKWLPIIPLMQILCLQAILDFINTPAGIAFQALGRPAVGSKIAAGGVIILAVVIYPLSSAWGISGAVASLVLSSLIPTVIFSYMSIRLMECTFLEFIKPIALSLISTVVMFFAVIAAKNYLAAQISIASFIALVLFGMFIYAGITLIFAKATNDDIYGLIKERIAALRRG